MGKNIIKIFLQKNACIATNRSAFVEVAVRSYLENKKRKK